MECFPIRATRFEAIAVYLNANRTLEESPLLQDRIGSIMEVKQMGRFLTLGIVFLALAMTAGCGSKKADTEEMQGEEAMGSMQMGDSLKSDEAWIREEPVDVKALDTDQDGFVYQDQMCWNVIADEEGKCPKCGMILQKVSIEDAVRNLTDNGFKVQ